MITTDGIEITLRDQYRCKFDGALCEWVYHHMDWWANDAYGDSESAVGWFCQLGKRILRGDSQGFVWLEHFGNEHEANQIMQALRHYDDVWSMGEWCENPDFEPFSSEHEDALGQALRYVEYCYRCDEQSCDPHTFDIWVMHGEPADAIGNGTNYNGKRA